MAIIGADGTVRHCLNVLRTRSKRRFSLPAAALFLLAIASPARLLAEPAHFWISTSNSTTTGPEASTIANANDGIQYLYIWAQPETQNIDAAYDATTNPFKVLQSFSLDLVSIQPTVDFLDDAIIVYNPSLDGAPRFKYVNDSLNSDSTPPLISEQTQQQVIDGSADRVVGMEGFSIYSTDGKGIGPTCSTDDSYCKTTPSGVPAWLVASVSYRIVPSDVPTELYLQIGSNGMNHLSVTDTPESSSLTTVVFGSGSAPVYTAGRYIDELYVLHKFGDREMTLSGDTPDLVIQPGLPGDFNDDGTVNSADYVVWRKSDGSPSGYAAWRSHFGTPTVGGGQATAIPEPNALPLVSLAICFILAAAAGTRVKRRPFGQRRLQVMPVIGQLPAESNRSAWFELPRHPYLGNSVLEGSSNKSTKKYTRLVLSLVVFAFLRQCVGPIVVLANK